MAAPFHRLLAFYSNRSNSPDTQTIRLQDSIRGNLALGLDIPVALGIAFGRHLWLRNTALFSLNIHVPSVPVTKTPLDGVDVDEKKLYTCSEIMAAAREKGLFAQFDAAGLWALAADVNTGLLSGRDVVQFQQGHLFTEIERKRRGRDHVLPLYRGGPIAAAGHSWVVKTMFNVDVYRDDFKND